MIQKQQLFWIDSLRALATVCVIVLHISGGIVNNYGYISDFNWWIGNIADSSVRFSVPIFLMISGALLLTQNYEIDIFFKKRVRRILLPFVFWCSIYIIIHIAFKVFYEKLDALTTLKNLILVGVSDHFWFVYMIVGISLFVPIIGKWIRNANEKEILYYLILWFCILFVNESIISWFHLTYFTGFIGYLILGYYLSIKSFNPKLRLNLIALFLIITGIAFSVFGTYYVSNKNGFLFTDFYSSLSPNVVLLSTGVFLYFKNLQITNVILTKIIFFISKYSYGIFLIHVLILNFLSKIGLDCNLISPILGIPLITIICFLISSGIIYLLSKMPLGKYVSGQ